LTLSGVIDSDGAIQLADRAATSTGGRLSVADTLLATCDTRSSILQLSSTGVPLALGHSERHATPGQRRVLAARDGGCTFPGCDAPAHWCDAHHIQHWQHGGRTDLNNLALLCRHHHGVTHRTGWHMAIDSDHHLRWVTPGGATIHGQRHGHTAPPGDRAGPAPPAAAA
jgi:hypothetical protein